MKLNSKVKNAIMLGGMCSVSYLAVYLARNILGTVTPQMIEGGSYTTENIGSLSSIYFITYALGQLVNGIIGDKIKSKYMISLGLILAGVSSVVFAFPFTTFSMAYIAYALAGFFLSMIYAPMTKLVAENTEHIYAVRCSLGYTLASFLGSPLAGILAMFIVWQSVFAVSSAILIAMGIICFVVFTLLEKKGIIKYKQYEAEKGRGSIKLLIKHEIVKYTLISILTGIVRTAVVFWLPTYIAQHLGFSPKNAALIFTISTLAISTTAFIANFVYELLGRNMNLTVFLTFCSAAVCFLIVFFVNHPVINIIFMVLAIMSSNSAATVLWSMYCPSLRDTGMVSSATGFLDFASYMAASVSSTLFANAVGSIGWSNLILIWFALMILGVIITLPFKKLFKKNN